MPKLVITGTLRLVGSFVVGILLYHSIGRGFPFAWEAAAFFMLLFGLLAWRAFQKPLARNRTRAGVAGLAAVAAVSFWGTSLKNKPANLPVPLAEITHYQITFSKSVALKPTSVSSVGQVQAVRANGKWYKASGKVAVFLPRSESADSLKYGQQLLVKGSLQTPAEPANPYQFNYKRYLGLQHIQWQVYLNDGTWQAIGYEPPSLLVSLSLQVRKKLERAFKAQIPTKRELTIAQALILGVQDDLDAATRNAYARTGTMHVLAVSGMHVGLLYGALLLFLKPMARGRKGKLLVFLVIVGVVWFYAFVTGMSASVLRSVTMFSLLELGKVLRRKASILNTLAVVAMVLLLYEPNFLFDVGFQLSFLAVAGIVLLQPLFLQVWNPERRMVRWVWELFAISVAAQLATFPLSLFYFHQFPVYFWAANLLAVPATSLGLYVGLAFMAFFWVPGLNVILAKVLQGLLWILNEFLLLVEFWPGAVLDGFVITPGQTVALYLFIGAAIMFLVYRKLAWLTFSVMCLAFLSGTELAEAQRLRRTQELVLHSVRKSSAVSLVQGRSVHFMADSAFRAQPQNFTYNVQPYWWAKDIKNEDAWFGAHFQNGAQKQEIAQHETDQGNRILVWRGKRLLWLKRLPRAVQKPLQVDAIVLQQNVWTTPDKLKSMFSTRLVVLDQTNARWYVQRKKQELQQAGYTVHLLEEDGAWHIRL
ncbi:ComEC/Rec2 family competence protein [Rufibacter sp. LB8]|uniref:ComEC/Rec2 family competence protein n=1 Tax=Rufibacter sp. LB8 TaxID=2777781 RepID=UPI00178C7AD7|nr:ComEC/Rec2 family competence protein [Rufibacter sp. LB8]